MINITYILIEIVIVIADNNAIYISSKLLVFLKELKNKKHYAWIFHKFVFEKIKKDYAQNWITI